MDNAYFKNPVKEFKKFVYYKDYDLVVEDLNKILFLEKRPITICSIDG